MSAIISFLQVIGTWIVGVLFKDFMDFLTQAFKNWFAQEQNTQTGDALLAAYKQAVESGDPNAIAKAGEALLNGFKSGS